MIVDKTPHLITWFHIWLGTITLVIGLGMKYSVINLTYFYSMQTGISFQDFSFGGEMADLGVPLLIFVTPLVNGIAVNRVIGGAVVFAGITAILTSIPNPPSSLIIQIMILRLMYGTAVRLVLAWMIAAVEKWADESIVPNALALIEAGFTVGLSMFLVTGAILASLGWSYTFIIAGTALLPLGLILFCTLPTEPLVDHTLTSVNDTTESETDPLLPKENQTDMKSPTRQYFENMWICMQDRKVLSLCLMGFVFGFNENVWFTFVSPWFRTFYGLDASEVGLSGVPMMIGGAAGLITTIVAGIRVFPARRTVFLSVVTLILVFASALLLERFKLLHLSVAVALLCLFSFGVSLFFSRVFLVVIEFAPTPDLNSSAISWFLTCFSLGAFCGGVSTPAMWRWGGFEGIVCVLLGTSLFNCVWILVKVVLRV